MTDNYTPTTEGLRSAWVDLYRPEYQEVAGAGFDRWLTGLWLEGQANGAADERERIADLLPTMAGWNPAETDTIQLAQKRIRILLPRPLRPARWVMGMVLPCGCPNPDGYATHQDGCRERPSDAPSQRVEELRQYLRELDGFAKANQEIIDGAESRGWIADRAAVGSRDAHLSAARRLRMILKEDAE